MTVIYVCRYRIGVHTDDFNTRSPDHKAHHTARSIMAEALDCSADISSSFVYVHTMTLPLPSQEGKEGSQSACNSPASSPQTTPKFPRRHSSWKHRKMPRSASTDVLVESPVSDSQYGRSTSHPAVTESGSMDNLAVAVKRHKSSREVCS